MDDEQIVEDVVDDDREVTDEDLKALKDGEVETSEEADETTEKETEDESEEEGESPSFVKEFPNIKGDTLEEYVRELEKTQHLSTAEGKRLADELAKKNSTSTDKDEIDTSDPLKLYAQQKMNEEIQTAYTDFTKAYPQATAGTPEYDQFTNEVAILSQTILNSQKRLASPKELYQKAAVILGWVPQTVTDKDKLDTALKDSAASSKTSTVTKAKSTSKITDAEIATAKAMGGWTDGKSDAEIRKELEAVQI